MHDKTMVKGVCKKCHNSSMMPSVDTVRLGQKWSLCEVVALVKG